MHRLGDIESAHTYYMKALEQEKHFVGKRYAQGGQYIEEYCNYFIAITASKAERETNPIEIDRKRKSLQGMTVSSELRTYFLPPPT